MKSHKKQLRFIVNPNCSWVRFPVSKMLSFPIGILDILETENHALKTLCFHSEIQWNFMKLHKNQLRFIVNSCSFWNAIFGFQNIKFPIGKVNILETGNHVLKTLWFHSEIWWNFMEKVILTCVRTANSYGFRDAISGLHNVKYSNWNT